MHVTPMPRGPYVVRSKRLLPGIADAPTCDDALQRDKMGKKDRIRVPATNPSLAQDTILPPSL